MNPRGGEAIMGKCDDPYSHNCKKKVVYERRYKPITYHNSVDPVFLCELCFEAMKKEGRIDPEKWKYAEHC
jgi:hypothetical protein